MAVSMAAALTIPTAQVGVISGRKFTVTVTLTESGGTATSLTSIQPFITNGQNVMSTNVRIGAVANSLTIANVTGAAVAIGANSTNNFNFECVIDGPDQLGVPAEPICNYLMGCTCQTSDGSVFSAPQLVIPISPRRSGAQGVFATPSPVPNEALGKTQIIGTSTNAYGNVAQQGSLQCDFGANSGSLVAAGILL